ncbi:MAG: photosystem I assembly protein Ycf4 [Cyanobacteria bacterium]|nr:photosystem I assembly protein Ycf4 [Cyanobacteriota bacterium]MDW8202984.1 photosystem I assembly protein Ycf4 [Cyanobacteriota bacterium SKYGB_h_bin112]
MNAHSELGDRLYQEILGSRRFSNYWWATVTTIGATGFFLASLSSYFKQNFLPFGNSIDLVFVPQGLAMGFYGVAGLALSAYLWLLIVWNVGGGYNEFNRQTGKVVIFRWGFPGKNRKVEISCPIADVQAIRIEVKEGLNPKRQLYLRAKGLKDIPLTRVGDPLPLSELENRGAELAKFLGVPLEGL